MKTKIQKEREQLQREKNLINFRAEMRLRDAYCGDGVASGRYFSNHGFRKQPEPLGPVATSDLDMEQEQETENGKA